MKKNEITLIVGDILIFILGIFLMLIPALGFDDMNFTFFIIMIIYALINYVVYMIIRRKNDYEHLFITLASVVAGASGVTFHVENPQMVIPLSLIGWISMMAIIKLIKMDYYHDRNNILWFVRTITFVLFLIFGTLTCINLFYNVKIQSIMLGFFFMVVAMLESLDPLIEFLLIKKRRSLVRRLKPVMIKENGVANIKASNPETTKKVTRKTSVKAKQTKTKK